MICLFLTTYLSTFFFYFCSSSTNLDVASMMPNAVHWPLLIYYYFLIFKLNY